jgi:hypothetical protein
VQKYKKLAFREILLALMIQLFERILTPWAFRGQKMIGQARFNVQNLLLQPKFNTCRFFLLTIIDPLARAQQTNKSAQICSKKRGLHNTVL